MTVQHVARDIKSLKIQGAENVAKESVKSLRYVLSDCRKKTAKQTVSSLYKARDVLFKTRPTEPCMRNALNFVLAECDARGENSALIDSVSKRIQQALDFFRESNERITEYGSQKIKDGMTVYTHCHSSTVTSIIMRAWEQGRRIEVHNTETRPRFQGRITSAELARKGIPVTHYVDSAMRFALKKADLMLIGADAISVEGKVVNKIGSELAAQIADRHDVPVYCCTNSWKFDPETVHGFEEPIEKRDTREVWDKPPKGVRVENPAFEKVSPKLVTGVVTELGIYKPQSLVNAVQKNYPWMFK